jgi:hypothetical protein
MDNKKPKTHYRSVAKSNHLGVADLEEFVEEGKTLVFTIKEVRKELNVSVAGRKGNYNIAYFVEDIKPLCLNAINAKRIRSFVKANKQLGIEAKSPWLEDWKNITIELYIDENVTMKGEKTGGVRIKTKQPQPKKTGKKTMSPKSFVACLEAVRIGTYTKEQVLSEYTLTNEQENKLNALKNG